MPDYRTVSINTSAPRPPQASVLMIYTGGTLGMVYDKNKQLVPFAFEQILEKAPELHLFDCEITVISYQIPLDSANMTPQHWLELARIIAQQYERYDGFVILHGTDTMAFSASALSFLLPGLAKPVIFTGAQLPVGAIRTDARSNLVTALGFAASAVTPQQPLIPEVCIYFDYQLLRGNRSKKVETAHFDAFKSENYPALARVGVNIEYNQAAILPRPAAASLGLVNKLNTDVALLKLFPGISASHISCMLGLPGLKGLVLETYGSGNAPTGDWFIGLLQEAVAAGILILNVSQCNGGRVVHGKYATSRRLAEIGVLSGADITFESAVAKMMVVLGQELPLEQAREALLTPLRGEMSVI